MGSSEDMDVDDFAVVLNSDSESVLVKGLRRFASQIRRDHGLLHEAVEPTPRPSLSPSDEESSDGDASGGTDEEDMVDNNEGTSTPMELEEEEEGGEEEGKEGARGELLAEQRPLGDRSADGGTGRGPPVEEGGRRRAAFAGFSEVGEAAGLLGDYLRGSPQLHDLLSLWDLDVRKSSRRLAAAHTDSIAAVLECLSAVHIHFATTATGGAGGVDAAASGFGGVDAAAVRSTSSLEATGLGLCRKLARDKMDELHAQLSTPTATKSGNPPGGVHRAGSKGATAVEEEEERAAATLRLLTNMAKFHRLAAKELAGGFQFTHKAFLKIVSRRGATSNGRSLLPQGDAASSAAGSGKKQKKRKLAEDIAVRNAQGDGKERAPQNRTDGWDRHRDLRHLSVDFLCSFMDSDDPAVQMQMVTGSRGSCVLGLIFRGTLWRDSLATSLRVVETLHRRLLRNRRVSRRSKADFFSVGTMEHLRKVFDDASPLLYEALHGLMWSLLCDPTASPFLLDVTTSVVPPTTLGGGESAADVEREEGRDKAFVASPRPLVAGLACLGAHEDLGQRELLLSTLKTCPSLLGAYLRSFSHAVLEARPTYRLLQTYSLLSTVLREVPVALYVERGDRDGSRNEGGGGRGFQQGRQTEALLWTVTPVSLTKKELTKGVLSGNPLLQASTMTLMASILDRSIRVATAAAAANSEVADMTSKLRQRMPEVQTLLGLRDKFGRGSSASGTGADIPGHQRDDKATFLRWRLLSLLDRYAAAIPEAITASRFDFFKLMSPSHSGGSGTRAAGIDSWERRREEPLVQLATLRLLARGGVVVTPAALGSGTNIGGGGGGQSGGRASLSGWLAKRTHATGAELGLSSHSMTDGADGDGAHAVGAAVEENTPLGSVLRVAIASEVKCHPPAIQQAARALAVRAMQSMGIVTVPTVRSGVLWFDGRGGESSRRGREMAAEGEAGVWLDSLTPGALGVLVCIVKSAFANAHALMAAGIRAAVGRAVGCEKGDWEVEFSPLSMAAVHALANDTTTPFKVDACGDGNGGVGVSVEAVRVFSAALSRVVHLHEDPRPFAAVCVAFAERAARAGKEAAGNGRVTSVATRTFRGLAASIARVVGRGALVDGDGGDGNGDGDGDRRMRDCEHQEAEPALQLLVKMDKQARRTISPAAVSAAEAEAAARLSSVLEDNPGINPFSLGPIVKELRANASANAAAASSELSSGQPGLHPRSTFGAPAAKPNVAVAGRSGALKVFLDRVSLPLLPRLLADSLTLVEDDAPAAPAAISEARGEILDVSFAEAEESVCLLLPAANERVFGALVRRLCGPTMEPARAAAAVRHIISHLDLVLDRRLPGAAAAAEAKEKRAAVSLLSTGIRLVAAACLGLLAADGIDVYISNQEVATRAEESTEGRKSGRVTNESKPRESVLQHDVDDDGSETAAEQPPWRARRRHAFEALVDVFHRPFLLRLACPACFGKGSGSIETAAVSNVKTSTCGGSRPTHSLPSSLGAVACTELSALLVASAAAAGKFEEAVMRRGREGGAKRFGRGFVAEAAAPFLEGLCGSVAAAVRSKSPELRWLSPAVIACRRLIPEEVLSPVLLAVLKRLATNKSPSTGPSVNSDNRGMDDGESLDVDASARSLLEQLLAPSSRRDRAEGGVSVGGGTVRGRASLMRKLEPTSVAALVELQVASPSPELGRLVALVLAEVSGDSLGVSSGGLGAPAALTAVTGGFLDEESVFRHFFGCLVVGDGGGVGDVDEVPWSSATDVGDSHDARILEELVRYSPAHAHWLAISMPKALRGLLPVPSAAAAAAAAAATTSLLSLRRPLEALLRMGVFFGDRASVTPPRSAERTGKVLQVDGRSDAIGSARDRHGTDGEPKHDRRQGEALARKSSSDKREETPPLSCCSLYPELSALLPGCIVPLFDAAERARGGGGGSSSEHADGGVAAVVCRKAASCSDGVNKMASCLEGRQTLLTCLDAVLEAVEVADVSVSTFKAATSALQRSISASERSEKVFTSPDVLARARARARLFAWLTAGAQHQPCGRSLSAVDDAIVEDGSAVSGASRAHRRHEIRMAYLLHCLSRAAAAAKAAGRASKKKAAAAADTAQPEADAASTANSGAGTRQKLSPPLSMGESLCGFLLKEVASIIGDAQSCGEFVTTEESAAGTMAARLLGLCQHDAAAEVGATATNRGVVHAFLTAVLKHRLGDPQSLQASRMVASVLYERHPPVLGRELRAAAGTDGMEEPHGLGSDGGGGRGASDVLPGWSASTMLERVVGHSNFLAVLTSEGPSQTELLKLLVLLLSAGGGVLDGGKGGRTPSAASAIVTADRGAGTVLVRPLLALYGASLSEGDKLVARSLRLLQASGVPLDPSVCLSWGTAATASTEAVANQSVYPRPKRRRAWRLIEALEPRRLRVSIEAFPITRELEPPSYSFEVGGLRAHPDDGAMLYGPKGANVTSNGRKRRGLDYDAVKEEHGEMEEEEEGEGSFETDGSESSRSASGSEDDDGDGDGNGDPGENDEQSSEKRASGHSRGRTDSGDGGDMGKQELAVDPRYGHDAYDAPGHASQIYDPCFLLPLVEWALRTKGVMAQAVCECSLLGYIIVSTSSLRCSTRAAAFACLTHLLDSLQQQQQQQQDGPKNASSEGAGRVTGGFKARRTTTDAAFRQRPQLALLLRCLKDGLETPLQRVPCAVALVLARVSEILASSPFSDLYKVFNSFLLHRPCIRLNELPLFDTLFTGVQPGEAGRSATGGGALGSSAYDPAAAAAKSRLWILRALRDGLRTSRDLELAAGKRVVPLLLAMADSPVGDGDTVFVGLVLDVLFRVARLRVSGTRYLLNSIGVVAWCRVMLGRGLSASDSDRTAFLRKGRPAGAAGVARRSSVSSGHRRLGRQQALPLHLQIHIISLLEHLLRCGRGLVPPTPSLLEEEFVLLAPDVVRCAAAAAAAGVLAVGDPGKAGRVGQGKKDAAGGTGSMNLVERSVALLEELQLGGRPFYCGALAVASAASWKNEERGRPGRGMLLTLGDALSLVGAVSAVANAPDSPPYVRSLKGRVVALLSSPGAIEVDRHRVSPIAAAAEHFHGALPLITWSLAVAHDEVRAGATPEESQCIDQSLPGPALDAEKSGAKRAEEGDGVAPAADQPTTRKATEVALSALGLVCLVDPGDNKREPLRGEPSLDPVVSEATFPAATAAPIDAVGPGTHHSAVAMAWSALTLATAAAVRLPKLSQASDEERCAYYRLSLWTTAVKAVLAVLKPFHLGGDDESHSGRESVSDECAVASRTSRPSLSWSAPIFGSRGPLLSALTRELRACELIYPRENLGDGEVVIADGGKGAGVVDQHPAGRSSSSSAIMVRLWAACTAARMLAAALPLPPPSQRSSMAAAGSPAPVMERTEFGPESTQEAASNDDCDMGKGERELSSLSQSKGNEVGCRVERAVAACFRALEAVPPDIAGDEAVMHFLRGVGEVLRNFVGDEGSRSVVSWRDVDAI